MDRIRSNTDGVMREANNRLGLSIGDFVDEMANSAKARSPVAEILGGHNRDSIASDSGTEGGTQYGRVYTQSGYGGWLELGTRKMAARPYIAPAYNDAMDTVGRG